MELGEPVKKKRHFPRLSNYYYNLKRIVSNRAALAGLIIVLIFLTFDVLDWVWPGYLGIAPGTNLSNALVAFHLPAPSTYNGRPFIVGSLIQLAPYGSYGALYTIVPPTLTGPTNTPGWWWWFGGTYYSLPVLPLVLASLKLDVTYTIIIVLAGGIFGTILGAAAGYRGGLLDEVVMRITDVFFSLPYFIFAIAIIYALGTSIVNVVIALIIVWWPNYARLARAQALKIRSFSYMEAAIASGSKGLRNLFSHVIPNSITPLFVQASLDIGVILQILVTLGFIGSKSGFGLRFHYESYFSPDIGNIMSWGIQYIFSYPINWWPVIVPGAAVIIFALGFSLLGDAIRDIFDPRTGR